MKQFPDATGFVYFLVKVMFILTGAMAEWIKAVAFVCKCNSETYIAIERFMVLSPVRSE